MSPPTTITTIPYPLGTTSTGVVIYENSSSMPAFDKNYVLKDSAGTVVSDVFNKGNLNFIDTTTFINNFNNNANITDSNDPDYENTSIPRAVLNDIIAFYNTNPDPNLNNLVNPNGPGFDQYGNPNTPVAPVTPFGAFVAPITVTLGTPVYDNTAKLLYTHATINYAITLNSAISNNAISGYDEDPFGGGSNPIYSGNFYTLDTQTSYHTLDTLLTIDPITGEFGYLCTITDLTNINKIVIDNVGSTVYILVTPTNDYSVVINSLSLSSVSNYSATTQLYHTRTVSGTEVSISAWNMNIDNNNDLYYLEHFRGNIQKVTGQSTVSTYVNFTYTPAIYGYRERSSNPAYGRPVSFVFDSNNNLYVSIDDTSFEPYYNFVNTNASGNGSKIPYSSTSCLMKIPYTNTPGTVYCPGTTHSAEQSFANNITVTNPNNLSNPYQVLQSLDMVFDSLGYLILSSQRYNYNVYRINPSSPDFTTPYFSNGGGLTIDNYDNIYTNASKIAGNYTFTHVYISDYQGQDSATLSLNNTTDSSLVDPNVVVYNILSSPTYGEIKYYSSNGGILLSTTQGTDFALSGDISNILSYSPNTSPNGLVGWEIISVDAGTGNYIVGDYIELGNPVDTSADYSVIPRWGNVQTVIVYFTRLDGSMISMSYGTAYNSDGSIIEQQYIPTTPPNVFSGWKVRSINSGYSNSQCTPLYSVGDLVYGFDSNTSYALYPSWTGSQSNNVICFKEDTNILCLIDSEEVYIPIQDLRKGTFVKTLASGYLPLEIIGYSNIYNSSNKERGIDRLYRCSQEKYPELLEDLIITGCHSILEKDISEEQRDKLITSTGKIYITENRYRLLACLDDRTDTYEVEGIHKIWHFALENENNYSNYGVYANGLLVESCSKRMMKEYADMTLIE